MIRNYACRECFEEIKRPNDVFVHAADHMVGTDGLMIPAPQYVPGCCKPGDMGPRHYASPNCESGRYPHCSCDTCF